MIEGLSALTRPCRVNVVTDSKYVVDAITLGWARKWRAQGWMRNKKEKALNPDLWETLLNLLDRHEVTVTLGQVFHLYHSRPPHGRDGHAHPFIPGHYSLRL